MGTAAISFGPKLGLLNNATIAEQYFDQFRPFLRGMDALIQASVINFASTPPGSPANGDAYIVLEGTDIWTGKDNNIAVWSTQITDAGNNVLSPGWDFYPPQAGFTVFLTAPSIDGPSFIYFDGTSWLNPSTFTFNGWVMYNPPAGFSQIIAQQAGTALTVTEPQGAGISIGNGDVQLKGYLSIPAYSSVIVADFVIGVDDIAAVSPSSVYTVDATSGNVQITLPPAPDVSNGGVVVYTIVRIDNSGNTVTLVPTSGDSIIGGSSVAVTGHGSVTVMATASASYWAITSQV